VLPVKKMVVEGVYFEPSCFDQYDWMLLTSPTMRHSCLSLASAPVWHDCLQLAVVARRRAERLALQAAEAAQAAAAARHDVRVDPEGDRGDHDDDAEHAAAELHAPRRHHHRNLRPARLPASAGPPPVVDLGGVEPCVLAKLHPVGLWAPGSLRASTASLALVRDAVLVADDVLQLLGVALRESTPRGRPPSSSRCQPVCSDP